MHRRGARDRAALILSALRLLSPSPSPRAQPAAGSGSVNQHDDHGSFARGRIRALLPGTILRTVLLVYSFTADMAAAQDVAQEAFVRAWQRWNTVSRYDQPLAWVRRVSINLVNSRWRRLLTARTYLERQREEHEPEVTPDHAMVVAALRRLPKSQREALVLHYLADMSVEDVAHHLDAPLGTVKSWLHRGREALAGALAIEAPEISTPATQEIIRRGRVRQGVRLAAGAAVILVIVLAIFAATRPTAIHIPVSPSRSSASCPAGQVPASLTVPAEEQVKVNVFNSTATVNLAASAVEDLRNRRFDVGTIGNDPADLTKEVALLRYGPKAVGAAYLLRAYLLDDRVTLAFDIDRQNSEVDLVLGGQFRNS